MNIYDQQDEMIPTYALSYLVNGDDSGLEPEDKKIIDSFMEPWYEEAEDRGGSVVISPSEEEPHFTWNPAFGLACEVVRTTILVLV